MRALVNGRGGQLYPGPGIPPTTKALHLGPLQQNRWSGSQALLGVV